MEALLGGAVSVTLSASDLQALELAQTALLSPLDYRTTDTWRAVASARVTRLLGADTAVFTPPRTIPGSARFYGRAFDVGGADVASDALDPGMTNTRLRRRLELSHRYLLYRAAFGATEIYVDWAVPEHLLDMEGMAFDPFPGKLSACLHVTDDYEQSPDDHESRGAFGKRGLTLLQLLLPAFRAGVRTRLAFLVHREALAGMLDRLVDGAAVWDSAGNCRYRNRALGDLLAADAERALLERRLAEVAQSMLARPGANRHATAASASDFTLVTAYNRYRLQATHGVGLGAGKPWVLVLVRPALRLPSAELLRARYSLSPRQSDVARRLAEGQSDAAIARALGISRRTAEHHAEAVRLKLGVHSRAALAAALQQTV
jgi:DNA-binding CsgD family transcriptional regulator